MSARIACGLAVMLLFTAGANAGWQAAPDARTPDFSGTWVRDAARSEHRAAADELTITQTGDEVDVRQTLCCRQAGEEWIITFYFNAWGPRSATPTHMSQNIVRRDQKPTQARWDGTALVLHAGPDLDVRGGSVRIWRLTAEGRDLLEDVINRGLGRAFDFKDASIPKAYARDRHVYVRR